MPLPNDNDPLRTTDQGPSLAPLASDTTTDHVPDDARRVPAQRVRDNLAGINRPALTQSVDVR